MIYVPNDGSNTVSVINGATNSVAATVAVGASPYAVAVNPVTNTAYVCNFSGGSVTAINGTTYATSTMTVGTNPLGMAINPLNNQIYVANDVSKTVSVINGVTNAVEAIISNASGTGPRAVGINPITDKIYVANSTSNNVSVIDGATYTAQTTAAFDGYPLYITANPANGSAWVSIYVSQAEALFGTEMLTACYYDGCPTGSYPTTPIINALTGTIYVPAYEGNEITVIAPNTYAGYSITDILSSQEPSKGVLNPATNTIYVSNSTGVTVINGTTLATQAVPTASAPIALDVNPVTNTIYAAVGTGVTVINGATNTVTDTINLAQQPAGLAVNPVTNTIYVCDLYNGSVGVDGVSVINGATNKITATLTIPAEYSQACGIAVNPVTNMIYAVWDVAEVLVINGATNSTTMFSVSSFLLSPSWLEINLASNKIYIGGAYLAEGYPGYLAAIDGATNAVDILQVGYGPNLIAVAPATGQVYVTNPYSQNVSVFAEQQVQAIPLTTAITPLTGNVTTSATPTFTFAATSSFSPSNTTPQAVWYQFDTWQGPWLRASGTEPNFTGTAPVLPAGQHILYAFATDGQDATSTGMAQGLIGNIASYVFAVTAPPAKIGPGCHGRICIVTR
ncbi:MAG: YncE family protein [Candidatus Sulfotelmatobacter sp.]